MATTARGTDDVQQVLDEAGAFLASDPVLHNVILTLLHSRLERPEPGRYWIVDVDDAVAGVVFRSPRTFHRDRDTDAGRRRDRRGRLHRRRGRAASGRER